MSPRRESTPPGNLGQGLLEPSPVTPPAPEAPPCPPPPRKAPSSEQPRTTVHKTVQEHDKGQSAEAHQWLVLAGERKKQTKQTSAKTPQKQPAPKPKIAAVKRSMEADAQNAVVYVYGTDFLPDWRLNQLPWQVKRFHDWYKEAASKGLKGIVARVPPDAFMGGESFIFIDFKDICAMFRAEKMDINLLAVWCLMQAQDALKTKQNICYLDPQRTYAGRYRVTIERNSEEYKNKTDQEVEDIRKELVENAKREMSCYIARAMLRFAKEDKSCVMAVHHVVDHYLAFMIYPSAGRIFVFDSADYELSAYQEFVNIIQDAYKYYVNQGGKHKTGYVRMAVRTKFPCQKQPKGSILCGYYCCEFLRCTNRYVSNPEDYDPSELQGPANAQSPTEIVTALQRDMCQFIRREIYHEKGNFFSPGQDMAAHPQLCKWPRDQWPETEDKIEKEKREKSDKSEKRAKSAKSAKQS
ncbi:hypothetical protein ACP70R_020759 [Stipagrostis hirtigluma subsp. patula]